MLAGLLDSATSASDADAPKKKRPMRKGEGKKGKKGPPRPAAAKGDKEEQPRKRSLFRRRCLGVAWTGNCGAQFCDKLGPERA